MKVAKQIADNHVKIMAICPGRVDTKMIKDIVKKGYNPSNRNLITLKKLQKRFILWYLINYVTIMDKK